MSGTPRELQLFIDGQWRGAGHRCRAPRGRGWATAPPRLRQEILLQAAQILRRREVAVLDRLARETGCGAAFGKMQLEFSVSLLRQASGIGYQSVGQIIPSDLRSTDNGSLGGMDRVKMQVSNTEPLGRLAVAADRVVDPTAGPRRRCGVDRPGGHDVHRLPPDRRCARPGRTVAAPGDPDCAKPPAGTA
jgi:hypothetical protein